MPPKEKPKYRNFVFTFNNWQDHPKREARFHDFNFDENVRYVAFSYEVAPTTGTPHLQGVAVLWEPRLEEWVWQEFPAGIYWKNMLGTFTQASDYCGKNGNQIFEFGDRPMQGKRTDINIFQRELESGKSFEQVARQENFVATAAKFQKFFTTYAGWVERDREDRELREEYATFVPRPWQARVLDIIAGGVIPRKIHWMWDPRGDVGKSYFAGYLDAVHGAFVGGFDKKADIAYAYNKQRIVVFDFPRGTDFTSMYPILEDLKNGRISSPKYESKTKRFPIPHVFVFANDAPDQRRMSSDRWDVVRI